MRRKQSFFRSHCLLTFTLEWLKVSAKGIIFVVYLVAFVPPSDGNQRGHLISLGPSIEFIFLKIKRLPAST